MSKSCRKRQRTNPRQSSPLSALYLLTCLILISGSVSAGKVQGVDKNTQVFWREEPPTAVETQNEEEDEERLQKSPRRIISFSREINQAKKQSTQTSEPHKMRTDLWRLHMHWKRRPASFLSSSAFDKELALEFADNGFVREMSENSEHLFALGKWTVSAAGVSWDLSQGDQKFLFRGILLLNPFGGYPKIVQGVVLDDSRSNPWFRPVVATFSGKGIGLDTADLSYKKRKK